MTRLSGQIRQINPEQLQRRGQFFLVREFEKDARIGRHGQPGILCQLVLKLTSTPSRITESDHHVSRVAVLTDRHQDIARRRQADFLIDHQRRLPTPERTMQDESTVCLHRPAEKHRQTGERRGFERHIDFLEQRGNIHVNRTIDYHTERTLVVMLGNIDQGFCKIGILHRWHGDEKMVGQIDACHDPRILSPTPGVTKGKSVLESVLVWFRRDLRSVDNTALAEATRRARNVFCVFVFDRDILDALPSPSDRRVEFIRESLIELDQSLRSNGGGLIIRSGKPVHEIPRLAQELSVSTVFANRDYEPQAKCRDADVSKALHSVGIGFESFKDQVIFEHPEILSQTGRPYTIFTPYRNAWLKRLTDDDLRLYLPETGKLSPPPATLEIPALEQIGFEPTNLRQIGIIPCRAGARRLIDDFRERIASYGVQRDFPAVKGVSYLSVHLRFGTISIRELATLAIEAGARSGREGAFVWLTELIWREFYFMILDCFPHVTERSFKPDFDRITWEDGALAKTRFAAWREGRTGYPLVDAAMRQLNATGYMHNRLRMVTASFLTKDLGIDWRRGEAYFARQLNDFDLAANNGGWQWAASSGCDAQPYFRIFNPVTQSERFDPQGRFIRRYAPELSAVPDRFIHAPWRMSSREQEQCGVIVGRDTPAPIVDHDTARQETLLRYAVVKNADGAAPRTPQSDRAALLPDTACRDTD